MLQLVNPDRNKTKIYRRMIKGGSEIESEEALNTTGKLTHIEALKEVFEAI